MSHVDTPLQEPLSGAAAPGSTPPGIWRDVTTGTWRIHGHAAGRIALADPHLGVVSEPPPVRALGDGRPPSAVEFMSSWFSRSPSGQHLDIRRHLARPYSEQSIAEFEAMLQGVADGHASVLGDSCDLVRDFLRPFVLRGTARMLAVPERQDELLTKVLNALSVVLERPRLDEQSMRAVDSCIQYLRALLEHLLALEAPPPVVQALSAVASTSGGIWTAVSTLAQLLTAGLHPTVTAAALAWRTLHASPGLLAGVRSGALNISAVCDEVLRLQPPFPFVHRWVHERCECLGVALAPGEHVLVDLSAVNRDPAMFDRPDEFVSGRDPRLSLSFSHGPHRCLGAALARLLATVALRTLLSQQPPLKPLAEGAEAGIIHTGHLMLVRSLPCRREANAHGSPAGVPPGGSPPAAAGG